MRVPNQVMVQIMQEVIDFFLIPKFEALGMNATGKWKDSLEARSVDGVGEIWGQYYSYWLANGRRPGKFPPIAPLIEWVKAKFPDLTEEKDIRSRAYQVSYKLKEKGSSYYPSGTDLLAILKSDEVIDYVLLRASEYLVDEMTNEIKKQINDNFA